MEVTLDLVNIFLILLYMSCICRHKEARYSLYICAGFSANFSVLYHWFLILWWASGERRQHFGGWPLRNITISWQMYIKFYRLAESGCFFISSLHLYTIFSFFGFPSPRLRNIFIFKHQVWFQILIQA